MYSEYTEEIISFWHSFLALLFGVPLFMSELFLRVDRASSCVALWKLWDPACQRLLEHQLQRPTSPYCALLFALSALYFVYDACGLTQTRPLTRREYGLIAHHICCAAGLLWSVWTGTDALFVLAGLVLGESANPPRLLARIGSQLHKRRRAEEQSVLASRQQPVSGTQAQERATIKDSQTRHRESQRASARTTEGVRDRQPREVQPAQSASIMPAVCSSVSGAESTAKGEGDRPQVQGLLQWCETFLIVHHETLFNVHALLFMFTRMLCFRFLVGVVWPLASSHVTRGSAALLLLFSVLALLEYMRSSNGPS